MRESDDELYEVNYYTKDTRRAPKVVYVTANERLNLQLPTEAPALLGSPGNNPDIAGPGGAKDVHRYDPSGLRSAMSATNGACVSVENCGPEPGNTALVSCVVDFLLRLLQCRAAAFAKPSLSLSDSQLLLFLCQPRQRVRVPASRSIFLPAYSLTRGIHRVAHARPSAVHRVGFSGGCDH